MKRFLILTAILFLVMMGIAQTQQGYVKTKGRMVNGKLVPGQGLKGATVSIKGRTTVLVKADDGAFSFPVPEVQFRVDSVRKKGYQLVDMEACPRSYKYSSNPLYIVMETPEQQLQDKLNAEKKIRRNLQKQLQEKEDEIEALKEQQKISDEEYRQALQKLYADQESNEQLISDMAKRYSELDYDQLDEFYRQVSYCIENGELVKADSLLKTRGDITAQVGDILQRGQIIQQEKEQIQKAETVQQADIEEAARRCYSYYETFAAQHLNDTAAYYLELRASLDTTNVDWLFEAGEFIRGYLADYDKALEYSQMGLRQSQLQFGETHETTADFYDEIGVVYTEKGDYDKGLENLNKALFIRGKLFGDNHSDIASSYNNLGEIYFRIRDYEKALEYMKKSLSILRIINNNNEDESFATAYNNICSVYTYTEEYDRALQYYNKALPIYIKTLGKDNPNVANVYNNIGFSHKRLGDYDNALEYYSNALSMRMHTTKLWNITKRLY